MAKMLEISLRERTVGVTVGKVNWTKVLFVGGLVVLLLFLSRPGCIAHLRPHPVATVFDFMRSVAVITSAVVYFAASRRNWFGVPVVALCCFVVAAMAINGASSFYVLETWAPTCAAALLGFSMGKVAKKELLWAIMIYFTVYSFVNAVTMVLFPDGIPGMKPRYYFCGNQNSAIIAVLCSFFASAVLDAEEGRRFGVRSALIGAVGLLQVILAHSSTTYIVFGFVLLGCIAIYRRKALSVLTLWTYLGLYMVAFAAIVVFRAQELFGFLIQNVLGETLDFSMRTQIWDIAIQRVLEGNPLIGCGSSLYNVAGLAISSAHNMLLETFVYGGALAAGCLGAIWAFAAHPLFKARRKTFSALLSLELGGFLILGLMEQTAWPALFIVLGMCAAMGSDFGSPRQCIGDATSEARIGCGRG